MVHHMLALFLSAVVLSSVVDAKMVQQRIPESLTLHRRAASSAAAGKDAQYVYSMNNPWQGFNATKWEPYVRYHARYMAIDCPDQHDTEFFDLCCKPRLAEKPDDSDYPKACSEAVKGAPQPDKAAAAIEAKVYAPLLKDGQVGFGGGAKQNPKKAATNPKKAAQAAADAKAAQEAADAKAKADQAAADAKAKADQEAAQKKAEQQKQADEAAKKAEQQKHDQQQQSHNDGGDNSSNNGGDSSHGNGNGGGGGFFSNIVGQLFTGGEATFYTQDGTTGACGKAVSDSDKVVALGIGVYGGPGDFSTVSSHCFKKVAIQNTANGKTVIAVVNDGCPECNNKHLDLSLGAYDEIGARDTGVLPITWAFIE